METFGGIVLLILLIYLFFTIVDYMLGAKITVEAEVVGGYKKDKHVDADGNDVSEKFYLNVTIGHRQVHVEVSNNCWYNHKPIVTVKAVIGKISGLYYFAKIV